MPLPVSFLLLVVGFVLLMKGAKTSDEDFY